MYKCLPSSGVCLIVRVRVLDWDPWDGVKMGMCESPVNQVLVAGMSLCRPARRFVLVLQLHESPLVVL